MNIELRPIAATDLVITRNIVLDAFGDEGEETAAFLDALRAEGCVLVEWPAQGSLGSDRSHRISSVWLEHAEAGRRGWIMLTPLAVRPDRQRQGIGIVFDTAASVGQTQFLLLRT